jgi:hypothetical protein
MSTLGATVSQLFARWRGQGLSIRPPCTLAAIVAFEKREQLILPEDLRAYWLAGDGMSETLGQSKDNEGFSFWPLHRLSRADKELAHRSPHTPVPPNAVDYYVFADYLDWCWAYAVKLRSDGVGTVVIVGAKAVNVVAPSFAEFIQLYLSDDRALYPEAT